MHVPEKLIQNLRSLFTTYKLIRKHVAGVKNRIHSLYKQELYPFTKQYIFGKKSRIQLKRINIDPATDFQLNILFNDLENKEKEIEKLKEYLMYLARPYLKQIEILTSMKGISIFTAIALIADISEINRFKSSMQDPAGGRPLSRCNTGVQEDRPRSARMGAERGPRFPGAVGSLPGRCGRAGGAPRRCRYDLGHRPPGAAVRRVRGGSQPGRQRRRRSNDDRPDDRRRHWQRS